MNRLLLQVQMVPFRILLFELVQTPTTRNDQNLSSTRSVKRNIEEKDSKHKKQNEDEEGDTLRLSGKTNNELLADNRRDGAKSFVPLTEIATEDNEEEEENY